MPKLKGGSRAEHEVAPNASQIVSSRRPRNDLPIEEVRFAADSLLEESGFEPSVPLSRKFLPGCCRREIPERLAGVPYEALVLSRDGDWLRALSAARTRRDRDFESGLLRQRARALA